jgi:hypothetical protein
VRERVQTRYREVLYGSKPMGSLEENGFEIGFEHSKYAVLGLSSGAGGWRA